ncbi:SNF2 family N-terminal domain-containing protein [Echria macrotheca]|uniref:SNF2 family N-terminal domain-containing protein n=1 Tax=Echria macrotheca TaxID=438768 RepID=A0AAJ0FD50_9PEZI|nr:SNF2 family N-terminal domain-containing protein [Echria macrotheca]
MEWPDQDENPEWCWPLLSKRPVDEALEPDEDRSTQRTHESRTLPKRLCTPVARYIQEPVFQDSQQSLCYEMATATPTVDWVQGGGVATQSETEWFMSGGSTEFGLWGASVPLLTLETADTPESPSAAIDFTVGASDFTSQWYPGDDISQQAISSQNLTFASGPMPSVGSGLLEIDYKTGSLNLEIGTGTFQAGIRPQMMDAQFDLEFGQDFGADYATSGIVKVDSSAGCELDMDVVEGDDEAVEGTTAEMRPSHPVKESTANEEGSSAHFVPDTCFGLLIIEDFQLCERFAKDQTSKEVGLDLHGQLVIVRVLESKEYAGQVRQASALPLAALLADSTIKLSATLKSPTVLEVILYGSGTRADAIGEMLLDHDHFLQQPDSFDESTTYINPQRLVQDDYDEEPIEVEQSVRPATLSARTKSKVTELLDLASGPTVFRAVQVSEMLKTPLREHQLKALAMMVEKESGVLRGAEFTPVWVDETEGTSTRFLNTITGRRIYHKPRISLGGLLADDMGLGKTLSMLALIAGSLARHGTGSRAKAQATLIVAPLSTLTAWQEQIKRHFKKDSLRFTVYQGSLRQKDAKILSSLDVVLTTYDTIRVEHIQREESEKIRGAIHSILWHRVVLDEAHVIQNRSSKRFQAVYALQARHRWCLTGTPIQNRLEDLGSLVEFLRVDPFDNPAAFRRIFMDAINEQKSKGWEHLRALVRAISLRRTKAALEQEIALPPKREITCSVFFDEDERRVYDLIKRRFRMAISTGGGQLNAFQLILRLRQICNHGVDLLPANLRDWLELASQYSFPTAIRPEICEACGRPPQIMDQEFLEGSSCGHQVCGSCRREPEDDLDRAWTPDCPICQREQLSVQSQGYLPISGDSPCYQPSSKVKVLLQNLERDRHAATAFGVPPEKSVVFSAWTGMLDLIGKALSARNITFQRVDGSKTFGQRCNALGEFRRDESCSVLLATLGSAAVGLDLTMATRVHLVEPGWNPMLEKQAFDRVHRIGQTRQVEKIRYVVEESDSVELYMLQRQKLKLSLIEASVGEDSLRCQEAIKDVVKDMGVILGS